MTQITTYVESLRLAASATKSQLNLAMHRGEEGRLIEGIVRGMLEKLLPKRFSIGTGFVINFVGEMSSQQDIVLFDNIQNAPLLYEGEAGVFTAESVYATIEVKKTLYENKLPEIAQKIADFRSMTRDKLMWLVREEERRTEAGYVISPKPEVVCTEVSPRSYLFALDIGKDDWGGREAPDKERFERFKKSVSSACDKTDCHFHGIYVLERNWFVARAANKSPAELLVYTDGLASMYRKILEDAMTFIVRPAFLQAYFEPETGVRHLKAAKGN